MVSILDKIHIEYSTEYSAEYAELMPKKYTEPKIYHGGDDYDISKRWYVYFSYFNAITGKMERQKPIYDNINRKYKTKEERLKAAKLLQKVVSKLLRRGYVPPNLMEFDDEKLYSVECAVDFALDSKLNVLAKTSFRDYKSRVNLFKDYLRKKGLLEVHIRTLQKKDIQDYLNSITKNSSVRNRNNARIILSSLFTVLEDHEIIERNFIRNIKPLKNKPVRNKTYSQEQVSQIHDFLKETNPYLLLFIKFVSYNFLRPIEVCRLQVKDINIKEKILVVRAKNKLVKTKIIPQIIVEELKQLSLGEQDAYLFTSKGVAVTNVVASNRRDYFTKQFYKVKQRLGIGKDFTLYSFRHTYITKLYRKLRDEHSYTEACDKLMLITGHSTLKALQQYLRDIDAELPDDWSEML